LPLVEFGDQDEELCSQFCPSFLAGCAEVEKELRLIFESLEVVD
jgi:hypothetical protein